MTNNRILTQIKKPGRYLGNEYNAVTKEWHSERLSFGLVFPDLYEIGMSHQGLQILYHLINSDKRFQAERCYCPDTDMEKLLREKQHPLTSLETGHAMGDFDVLGFTLPYELCYTNILTVLDLSGIPLYSVDRNDNHPLVIGGGACSLNPEPVADFFDAILLGDGEEAIMEIADQLHKAKSVGASKASMLDLLEKVPGVYIPSRFNISYSEDPENIAIKRVEAVGDIKTVSRRIVADLNQIEHLKRPLVPNAKIVHDRLGVEVARGCTRGCRFCQAGITYRPVRERTPEQVLELASEGIENSGFEELALLSLSTGDYSCLDHALVPLMDKFSEKYISVAMPSMRVGTLTPAIMEQVKRVRKTGFTLAPEAGSERLRRVINKGITEEDLLETCSKAFELGWRTIKCYFMIGLPTETEQDIDEIIELVRKIMATRDGGGGRGKKQVNVSVGTFVPKPHTPYQWEKQLTIDESAERFKRLREGLPRKGCNLKYHNPKVSYLEGVFSRGDRRLSALLETAWRNGARLDGWTEYFNLDRWLNAAAECNLNLDAYLQARNIDEPLPWSHLESGVSIEFLQDELDKSKAEVYTPDCRYHACQNCGLCDFDTLMPIVHNRNRKESPLPAQPDALRSQETGHFKYMVHYEKRGRVSFLGHLEILQLIFRALRRAEVPTNFSKGFNPSPKISFGPALPVGTESEAEFFMMDLYQPLSSTKETIASLNTALTPGLLVKDIELHSGKIPQKIKTSYTLTFPTDISEEQQIKIREFLQTDSRLVKKIRKGKVKEIDIRPLIADLFLTSLQKIQIDIIGASTQPGIKPLEAIAEILELENNLSQEIRIIKNRWTSLD